MKKALWAVVIVGFALLVSWFFLAQKKVKTVSPISLTSFPTPTIPPTILPQNEQKMIFTPYWSMRKEAIQSDGYDELFYFGVAANDKGVEKTDDGFKKISQFLAKSDNSKKRFLTIVMTDSKINSLVLESRFVQERIVNESVAIAKQYGFDGVVLDFEIASLSFQSVIDKITSFYKIFANETKANDLTFYITIYGDAIYKLRPYDVKSLGKTADKVLIMAYDFHKARGNPGPNLPLYGKDKYGYDMTLMISDFLKVVPKEKLVVVFGFFGYDWKVDNKKQGIDTASSFSVRQMEQRYLKSCPVSECKVVRDEKSKETSVQYRDSDDVLHMVWFEDLSSVNEKKKYLQSKGISSFAFWAYSYF